MLVIRILITNYIVLFMLIQCHIYTYVLQTIDLQKHVSFTPHIHGDWVVCVLLEQIAITLNQYLLLMNDQFTTL